MTPQSELLELVCRTAEDLCSLDHKISPVELDPEGGIYAEVGEGFNNGTYYDKSAVRTIPVLFLCREKNQQRCMDQLSGICNHLQSLKQYPQGSMIRWLNTTTAKEPNKIGRDEGGMYHYSCIINCLVYF